MTILLTGGNGFIGGYLAEKLKGEHDVHNIKHPADKLEKPDMTHHEGDLMDYETIGDILKEVRPEIIIHLAARTEVEKSFYDPIDFSAVNYVGTVNLIEKAKDLKNLKLFMFSSTMETYGAQPQVERAIFEDEELVNPGAWAFTEETPQNPNAPYAVAKIGCEYYLKYAERAYGLPWTAFRQTNAYGRWDNDFFVVEQFITQMLKNPDKAEFGYALPYRNFIHIDDLINLYITVINNPEKAEGEIFCTGPNNAIQIGQLAKLIAKKLDWNGTIEWNRKPRRAGEIYYLNSEATKAKELLGWEPKISLDEGLDRTIEIWKNKLKSQS